MLSAKKTIAIIFISLLYICFTPVIAKAEKMLEVTAQTVNIRSGPSTSYDKIDSVNLGNTFRVLQEKNGWYQIELADGGKGWVIGTYAKTFTSDKLPQYINIADGTVNIRSGPGTSYAKIGELKPGTNHSVSGESGDWYEISFNGDSKGYVAKWVVEVVYATSGEENPGNIIDQVLPDGYKQGSVNTDILNLRASASLSSNKICTLAKGTRVAIYERSGDWYRIITESNLNGWVHYQYISLDNTVTSVITAQEVGLPVWAESGSAYGEIEMDWQEDDNNTYIYLQSDEVLVYKLSSDSNSLELNTDMEISGDLPNRDDISAEIGGDFDNILKITHNSGIYYSKEVSQDGKELTLRFSLSPLYGKIIYLDPGHGCYNTSGYFDYGATGPTGLRESNVAYSITQKTESILEEWGADVRLTRGEKCYLSLEERAWMANSAHADIFVSIHANAATSSVANGTSTWFHAPITDPNYDREKRKLLAEAVQKALLEAAGRSNYGVREDKYVVLRETDMPSILIETAFISNPTEESLLAQDSFRQTLAEGIAEGIKNYFQIIE